MMRERMGRRWIWIEWEEAHIDMLFWRWGLEKMEFGQDYAFVHDRYGCMMPREAIHTILGSKVVSPQSSNAKYISVAILFYSTPNFISHSL